MTSSAQILEQIEHRVRSRIDDVRARYRAALLGDEPPPVRLDAFSKPIRIDRIRKIVVPFDLHHPTMWNESGDAISNQSLVGRTNLALFVGRQRHLSARQWLRILTLIARDDGDYVGSELSLCLFLDLTVTEPTANPEIELPIWTAVAQLLATGQTERNVFTVMPALVSDQDVLHAEIPAGVREADLLAPRGDAGPRESLARYQARLLTEVRPELAESFARVTSDNDLAVLFRSSAAELRSYIREQVFARVAQALDDDALA